MFFSVTTRTRIRMSGQKTINQPNHDESVKGFGIMNPNQPPQQIPTAQSNLSGTGNPLNFGANMQQQSQQQQQLNMGHQPLQPQHIMGIMSNPAMAVAAAGNPLFPPPAILSNPGAFLAFQPGIYAAYHQATMPQQTANVSTGNSANNSSSIGGMAGMSSATSNLLRPHPSQMPQAQGIGPIAPLGGGQFAITQQQPCPVAPASACPAPGSHESSEKDEKKRASGGRNSEAKQEDRAKLARDRNREHARSTRMRKKAYVQKLKELVEGLHAERTEEVRQRRVAIQHLAESQNVRRDVVRTFLRYHCNFEPNERKWATILEDDFFLKQPVTPFRAFRRTEIEKNCRISRGIQAVICDAASFSVMIEGIGSRSPRWMQVKREEFLQLEQAKRGSKKMPRCIERQESRFQHAISSLSSSSDSDSNRGSTIGHGNPENAARQSKKPKFNKAISTDPQEGTNETSNKKVSSSSGSGTGSGSGSDSGNKADASKDFHDYNAAPLPDPKLGDSERSSGDDDSPEDSNGVGSNGNEGKRPISTDSSSGDDDSPVSHAAKRCKVDIGNAFEKQSRSISTIPSNIAKKGGILHNIRPVEVISSVVNGAARLQVAPAVQLPPFAGIGKRVTSVPPSETGVPSETGSKIRSPSTSSVANGPAVIAHDADTSSEEASKIPSIKGFYHINEDDMILMEDVLMCPYVFRSHDAVLCGAYSECAMPGMLRAVFSSRNKLKSLEFVYDAMGLMQQLERASGNEGSAQIIPGSLEMALAPNSCEARVITLAQAPYLIVNVNDVWTRITGYTQLEVEGKEYLTLMEGEGTVADAQTRPGHPPHKLCEVAKGRPACSTNIHYDSDGRDFVEFVCSYPLTSASDEITHILHVSKELPSFPGSLLRRGN